MSELLDSVSKENFIDLASKAQRNDFSKIVNFLKQKNISRLFHFTHVSNLESILDIGIETRMFLELSAFSFQATDPIRMDRFTESISVSIGEPNRLLLPLKSLDSEHQLVILEVSANSLLTQNFAAFPSNAASGVFKSEILNNPARYVGIRALVGLYLNAPLRNEARLSLDVPTDTQAEILFFDSIAPSKIQKIHISPLFPLTMRSTVERLRSQSEGPLFEFVCECGLFNRSEGPFRKYSPEWEEYGK